MPTGKDLIRKGAKEAAGVAVPQSPAKLGKLGYLKPKSLKCKGGQSWDKKTGKCVDAGKLKQR